MSVEGLKSVVDLALNAIVSIAALLPNVPTPLNCKFPLITALPDVCSEAALICPDTPSPPNTSNAPVPVVVEAVVSETIVALENVLAPAIV